MATGQAWDPPSSYPLFLEAELVWDREEVNTMYRPQEKLEGDSADEENSADEEVMVCADESALLYMEALSFVVFAISPKNVEQLKFLFFIFFLAFLVLFLFSGKP